LENYGIKNINILKLILQMGKLRHKEMEKFTQPFLAEDCLFSNQMQVPLFPENNFFFSLLGHRILSLAFHSLISRITAP